MPPPDSYPLFDGLRFVLASAVALGHVGLITWSHAGNLAVQTFFALSGWLIGGILFRATPDRLPRFFFNRATRIWIPYFFAVAVLFGVSLLRDKIDARWFEFLFYDLTFTHNWFSLKPSDSIALAQMPLQGTGNHFWSISVEEQFYLVAPLLIVALPIGRRYGFWLIALPLLWRFNYDFASIGLGVLAAKVRGDFGDRQTGGGAILALAAMAALSFAALLYGLPYAVFAPIFSIAVVLLCAQPGRRSPVAVFLGGVSYPMYLNHWMGAFVVNGAVKHLPAMPVLVAQFASYAGGVAAGIVAYLLIDRVVMARRDGFFHVRLGRAVAAVAYLAVIAGLLFGLVRWTLYAS